MSKKHVEHLEEELKELKRELCACRSSEDAQKYTDIRLKVDEICTHIRYAKRELD